MNPGNKKPVKFCFRLLMINDMIHAMAINNNYNILFQKRRHVSIQTEIHPCMKSTGTQTEQLHFSNDHARVDLDESFESLATTTSEASEWTPPETDKNNNLDNQESPSSHHSRKFIVLEECLDQLLRFCTICGRKCDHKKLLLGQCWLFLGFVSAGRLLHGNHNP